jgi:hypothetical protein
VDYHRVHFLDARGKLTKSIELDKTEWHHLLLDNSRRVVLIKGWTWTIVSETGVQVKINAQKSKKVYEDFPSMHFITKDNYLLVLGSNPATAFDLDSGKIVYSLQLERQMIPHRLFLHRGERLVCDDRLDNKLRVSGYLPRMDAHLLTLVVLFSDGKILSFF